MKRTLALDAIYGFFAITSLLAGGLLFYAAIDIGWLLLGGVAVGTIGASLLTFDQLRKRLRGET